MQCGVFILSGFWDFGLLGIFGELAGEGSVAVAVGVMWRYVM